MHAPSPLDIALLVVRRESGNPFANVVRQNPQISPGVGTICNQLTVSNGVIENVAAIPN